MSNNVLVVGSGGREHAIVWKLSQSPHVKEVFAVPGSVGIATVPKATNVFLDFSNFQVNLHSLVTIRLRMLYLPSH